jgi:polar amino acid transport system substrate-binding protein
MEVPVKCRVTLLFALMTLVLIRGGAAEPGSPAVRSELVPTGQLRVSIFVLPNVAVKDEAGELHGVAVDLSRELGRELGVPVLVSPARTPSIAVDQIRNGEADLTFLVNLPDRAAVIDFTPSYVDFEVSYLVPAGSDIRTMDDVDRAPHRIITFENGLIAQKLRRDLHTATVIGSPMALPKISLDKLKANEGDAYSDIRHLLVQMQRDFPGSYIVPGSFMNVSLAIGHPKGRPAEAAYLAQFISTLKGSGFIQRAIDQAALQGANVPP